MYALAVSENIYQTQEYKECFQLLNFQSKDELCKKISAIEELLLTEIRKRNNENRTFLEEFHKKLAVYVNNLRVVDQDSDNNETDEENQENLFAGCKDRTKLKTVGFNVFCICIKNFYYYRNCWNCQRRVNR